jgi:3-oxoadipate enol-lactonase
VSLPGALSRNAFLERFPGTLSWNAFLERFPGTLSWNARQRRQFMRKSGRARIARNQAHVPADPMAIMKVADYAFNVLVEGDETKPALLVSDPLGTNLHIWDRQMPALLEHFRVVRADSRGHGASVADEGPYSIEGLGRDALALLDALGIEQAYWLGLSKGGMVGLWVLVHAPGRIARAVLANTAARVPGPDLWNSRIRSARATGMDAVAEAVAERWFTKGFRKSHADEVERVLSMVRATPLQGYLATCSALRDMDLREAIRGIAVPVLVITGRHDPSTPPERGAFIASAIKGAKLVTLEASPISNVEDPENFTRAVVDFLTTS